MKQISWFMQRIGQKITGSHHAEPVLIESAADAHRLYVLQNSNNHSFNEHFDEVTAEQEAQDLPQEPVKKKARK